MEEFKKMEIELAKKILDIKKDKGDLIEEWENSLNNIELIIKKKGGAIQ
ncbi:hypothetical protein [Clostridium sp. C2-6-12]|nr:hypothetical protein [Clostridium sp. C2-6-12]